MIYEKELKNFFKNLWYSNAPYKVFITQRSFDLNQQILNELRKEDPKRYEDCCKNGLQKMFLNENLEEIQKKLQNLFEMIKIVNGKK